MNALPKVCAVITGPLDDYTREALRAVVDDAGRGVTLRFDPFPVPLPSVQPAPAPVPAPPKPRAPGVADLITATAFETGVSVARIMGDGRCRADLRARMAVCWAARELLGASAKGIGRALGNRDHSTILHAWMRGQALMDSDPAFRLLIDKLRLAMEAGEVTGSATPARFNTADQRRRVLLGKVHIAKKQLGLGDDDYRAVIFRVTGNISAGDCTEAELIKVIEEFAQKGFTAKAKPKSASAGKRPADHPVARKARALWISLHQLGAIDDPAESALEAFARQLGAARLQWADQALAYRLIEALKAIGLRNGWDSSLEGVKAAAGPVVLKRRLVEAIVVKLQDADLVPAEWGVRRIAFDLAGMDIQSVLTATTEELEVLAQALGDKLRANTGQVKP